MSILAILEDIGSDTKRKHKLSVLESNKTNAVLCDAIKLALDPYVNFYIKKIPEYVPTSKQDLPWALEQLEKLKSRELTGNAGIAHLTDILTNLSQDDATVIERIIGKDLRCGMAAATVNAVIKGFIPTYPCLLARPGTTKNLDNIVFPAFSQLKADGLRVNLHLSKNGVGICGRSGRNIDLLGMMDEELRRLHSVIGYDVVIDGELIVVKNGKTLDRKTGNGIINKAIKGTITPEEAAMIKAQVWDIIPMDEFYKGISTKIYYDRFVAIKAALCNTYACVSPELIKIWLIPSRIVDDMVVAQDHFEEMLKDDYEGTMLKNFSGVWEDTRSKDIVKLKAEKECDLEVIGWNPGKGEFVGLVGSLICASADRKVRVAISGFSLELRNEITEEIDDWLSSIVTVRYNERIKSKSRSEVDSLFLPRFLEKRYDKFEANRSNEIE